MLGNPENGKHAPPSPHGWASSHIGRQVKELGVNAVALDAGPTQSTSPTSFEAYGASIAHRNPTNTVGTSHPVNTTAPGNSG